MTKYFKIAFLAIGLAFLVAVMLKIEATIAQEDMMVAYAFAIIIEVKELREQMNLSKNWAEFQEAEMEAFKASIKRDNQNNAAIRAAAKKL